MVGHTSTKMVGHYAHSINVQPGRTRHYFKLDNDDERIWMDTDHVLAESELARYGRRSLCLVSCCGTHYHWLSVMYHWHWLSSVHDWRIFCFPEPTGHHHSASVTISAVKFVCANTNLLTYLLSYLLHRVIWTLHKLVKAKWSEPRMKRNWSY